MPDKKPLWSGRCSFFGGPEDGPEAGNNRPDWREEGLAIFDVNDARNPKYAKLFFSPDECGFIERALARRLKANQVKGFAARFDYSVTPKASLKDAVYIARNARTGQQCTVRPIDWGPNVKTGREIDLTPAAGFCLQVATDDEVEIWDPRDLAEDPPDPKLDDCTIEESTPPPEPWRSVPGAANPPGRTGHEGRGTSMLGRILMFIAPLALSLVATGGGIAINKLGGVQGILTKVLSFVFGKALDGVAKAEVAGGPADEKRSIAIGETTVWAMISKVFPVVGEWLVTALVSWVNAQSGTTEPGASFKPVVEEANVEGKRLWQLLFEKAAA